MTGLDLKAFIAVPPAVVMQAFFDPEALGAWWRVRRAVTTPRILGPYAIEWVPTEFRDDVLGRLGGVFRGTVMQYHAKQGFFVADAYWLPPDGEPIGPMALEATCTLLGDRTVLKVRQSGWESSPRWSRYYDLIATGFTLALDELKRYAESHWND